MSEENPHSAENSPEIPAANRPRFSGRTVYVVCIAVAVVVLGVYMSFFGESSIVKAISYQKTIDSLENCIQQQQDSLNYYRDLNRRINSDPSLTEQVVREQYNMKRDNEDIFVFK